MLVFPPVPHLERKPLRGQDAAAAKRWADDVDRYRPYVPRLVFFKWLDERYYKGSAMSEVAAGKLGWDSENRRRYLFAWLPRYFKDNPLLGRAWSTHQIPTLALAASAHSHRCGEFAFFELACDFCGTDRAKQREFFLLWFFFMQATGAPSDCCTFNYLHRSLVTSLMYADKKTEAVSPFGLYLSPRFDDTLVEKWLL